RLLFHWTSIAAIVRRETVCSHILDVMYMKGQKAMAKAEFSQAIFIHANPARVKALLFDYSQHTHLHPMIVPMRTLEPAKTEDGRALRCHRITDRMRMGPLTFRFTYYATIFEDGQGELVGDAYQNPGVHLRGHSLPARGPGRARQRTRDVRGATPPAWD